MSVSPKVSAASIGAAAATLVSDIVARRVFHGSAPADVLALVGAAATAGVTFVCGYVAKHTPADVKDAVSEAVDEFEEVTPAPEVAPPVGG